MKDRERTAAVLTVQDVRKSFRTREGMLDVLRGVSLSVVRDEMVGIVGASGSGKSTLFRVIAGIERPDSGSVSY